MKIFFLLFISLSFCLMSCENDQNKRTPEETCKAFVDNLAKKEYEATKKYTSQATDPYMDLLTKGADIFGKMNQKGNNFQSLVAVKEPSNLSYNCAVHAKKATCQCTNSDNKTVSFELQLIQENGQWVVHQPKETTVQ